ncbi:MAG: bifunctional nuclease family protein [Candidatus Latescibacterota bacterium]|nr:MAG: bifunctional nuclease family protein [Candidatus Latescibacterota bacterium]
MKNGDNDLLRVEIGGLIKDQRENPIVLLKGVESDDVLPIWIGHAEALSIDLQLQGKSFDRPLTHDLLKTAVESLGATVVRVAVTDLRDNVFFAKIFIQRGSEVFAIDARPSDSIALAVRTRSPIFVAKSVFENHKNALENDQNLRESSDEELRRYLKDLDPGEF